MTCYLREEDSLRGGKKLTTIGHHNDKDGSLQGILEKEESNSSEKEGRVSSGILSSTWGAEVVLTRGKDIAGQ